MKGIFQRTELLVGSECMERMARTRVIVFGVGGVGSWCAESLARSGIGHITIVDKDCVAESNINRQLMATTSTIGKSKVEVLGRRMLDINPDLHLTCIHDVYTADTQGRYDIDSYDYVVDAIDSIADKALLILNTCRSKARLFSSMGAALKSNPARIKTAEFWQVKGCPLARALRNHFKRSNTFPARKFKCVYSDELLKNIYPPPQTQNEETGTETPQAATANRGNGTVVHATAMFGLYLAWMVIDDIKTNAPA